MIFPVTLLQRIGGIWMEMKIQNVKF